MDLLNEWRKRIEAIGKKHNTEIDNLQKNKIEKSMKNSNKSLYKIHKRSLPAGLDQPIAFNLLEKEANFLLKRLKTKLMHYEENGPRIVHYYDKVRQDGYKSGIYDNDLPSLTKEENQQIEIQRDFDWKD